jgi:HD superfamily phosphohydrolase
MCSVHYGRYNVSALIDAFSLTAAGALVLQESRLDALTHFYVARDSMYRQVYQHRVLQAADLLTERVVLRVRDLLTASQPSQPGLFADDVMQRVLLAKNYATDLPLEALFQMTEHWWHYHVEQWCRATDRVLADLASRLRDRRLLKTIRASTAEEGQALLDQAKEVAKELGYDPRYYVSLVHNFDKHRSKREEPPLVLLDNGQTVPVTTVEPLIHEMMERSELPRAWLVVPKEIKVRLGRSR